MSAVSPDGAAATGRPTLAVFKLASCDGCQLTLLDCEDELLDIAATVEIATFTEMTKHAVDGPYDLVLVEGSVTTDADLERLRSIRANARRLVAIGSCATSGGIQALRNFARPGAFVHHVYPHPEYLATLATSTPVSDHVEVDFELRGCPIDRRQLLEVVTAALAGRRPVVPGHSVCQECKARGTVCLLVRDGAACLGPVTRAGCGAICPAVGRGCFGCFGPADTANTSSLSARLGADGHGSAELARLFRTFTAGAPAFRSASEGLESEAASEASARDGAMVEDAGTGPAGRRSR